MNSYIVTITSSAAVIDEIERRIRELFPKDCTDKLAFQREKPEVIEFTPPFIESVFFGGKMTVTRDETEDIC